MFRMQDFGDLNALPPDVLRLFLTNRQFDTACLASLKYTCRSFRELLNSDDFVAERLWAIKRHQSLGEALRSLPVTKLLVERHGVDINAWQEVIEEEGPSVRLPILVYAVLARQAGPTTAATDVLEYLLGRPGIDVNAVTTRHGTARHCACALGDVAAAELLLAHPAVDVNHHPRVVGIGGIPTFVDRNEHVLDTAWDRSFMDIVRLLLCRRGPNAVVWEPQLMTSLLNYLEPEEVACQLYLHCADVPITPVMLIEWWINIYATVFGRRRDLSLGRLLQHPGVSQAAFGEAIARLTASPHMLDRNTAQAVLSDTRMGRAYRRAH